MVVLLTVLALPLFVVGAATGCTSVGSPVLVSTASELKFVVRVLSVEFCTVMAAAEVGDVAVLFSMLFVLLLLLISPLVLPMRFSVECRRLPGAGSMLRLPLDGLCSMLVMVEERDGPGGVWTVVSVPFCPLVAGGVT